VNISFHFSGTHAQGQMMGYRLSAHSLFEEMAKPILSVAAPFCIPTSNVHFGSRLTKIGI
jgi:hypothetical protein